MPQRWILGCLRRAMNWPQLSCSHLSNLYLTKAEWHACLPSILDQHGYSTDIGPPVPSQNTWESWRQPAQIEVGWLWTVWVWEEDDVLQFKWLKREHGWCQLSMVTPATSAFHKFLEYLPLAADERGVPFAIMFLSAEGADFLPQVLDSMQGRYFRNLPIQLFENVAPQWISRVQRL